MLTAAVAAPAIVETYVEITPAVKPARRSKPPVLTSWLDMPRIYGQAGYDAGRLTGSDKATLAYLYRDQGIVFSPLGNGEYRVTLRAAEGDED